MNRGIKSSGLGHTAPNDSRLNRPPIIGQQQQIQLQLQHLQSNRQELPQRLCSEQGDPNVVQQNTNNIERIHSQQNSPTNLQPKLQQPQQEQSQSQPQSDEQTPMKRNVFKMKSRPKKNDRQQNGNSCNVIPLTAGAAVIATKSPPKSHSVTIALNGNMNVAQQSPTSNEPQSHSRSFNPLIPSLSTSMSSSPIQTITAASMISTTPLTGASTSASSSIALTTTTTASAVTSPIIAITAAQASLAGFLSLPSRPTSTIKAPTTAAQATIDAAAAAASPKASMSNSAKKPALSWAPAVAPHSTPRKQSSPQKSADKPEPMLIELSPPVSPDAQKIARPANSTPKKPSPDSKKRMTPFQWELYFQLQTGQAAPKEAFMQSHDRLVNDFQIGMKLEARDPKNNSSWCLASVISIEGLRIKLRFDGGGNTNDFYELINSDSIRPYGSKPNEVLLPPISFEGNLMGYPRFVDKVLSKDEAIVAPAQCFLPTPKKPPTNLFKVGMKLEAIDRKNPFLICPASIGEVKGDDVKVIFDGWRGSFDYTCKYYSRDIFPVNWCRDNNYYLTPPNGWEQIVASKSANQYHKDLGAKQKQTQSQPNLSVNATNLTSAVDLELEFPDTSSQNEDSVDIYPDEIKYQCQRAIPYNEWPKRKSEAERSIATNDSPTNPMTSSNFSAPHNQLSASTNSTASKSMQESVPKPVFIKRGRGRPSKKQKLDESLLQHTLKPVPAIRSEPGALRSRSSPSSSEDGLDRMPDRALEPQSDTDSTVYVGWSVGDVVEYIKSQEPELEKYTQAFVEQEITGIAFVSLIPDMMIRHMGLKLGPALRITRLIERLKRRESI